MNSAELLADAFGRVRETVHGAVEGLTADELTARLDGEANSIAWLVWHLTRVQDDHVADLAGTEQIWTAQGWFDRFQLPFATGATGYGQHSDDVAAVRVDTPALLLGYYDAVHERTVGHVRGLADADLDRVVDENWTPAVTQGVRLLSIISDDLQHAGQAAYIRGVLRRR
ncbi:mycothiol transferase [Streptomyces sp. H39-S7]|uniref:mycothiol transferase n=1 Tax=Streptomyces sp. H39-S7 TaxID=3004357 RepID=UPI0022AFE194|nr:DUF664 domain-containing protein [Streptomyces sp. H39-S7]MCZ4123046.1 DUF664 domain-containing protein [Streptomyces sp. H39-S7]